MHDKFKNCFFAATFILTLLAGTQNLFSAPRESIFALHTFEQSYFSGGGSFAKAFTSEYVYAFDVLGSKRIFSKFGAGASANFSVDRFFSRHYASAWAYYIIARRVSICASADVTGVYFGGARNLSNVEDPLLQSSNSREHLSNSAAIAIDASRGWKFAAEIRNTLAPDISAVGADEYHAPIEFQTCLLKEFTFGAQVFTKFTVPIDSLDNVKFAADVFLPVIANKLAVLLNVTEQGAGVGLSFAFENAAFAYCLQKKIGDANNIYDSQSSARFEITSPKSAKTPPQDVPQIFTNQQFPWAMHKTKSQIVLNIFTDEQTFDSIRIITSPNETIRCNYQQNSWQCVLKQIPYPQTSFELFYKNSTYFCNKIYRFPSEAMRYLPAADEFQFISPHENVSPHFVETISRCAQNRFPLYIDAPESVATNLYFANTSADRFLLAAPNFSPAPPNVKMLSQFVVEKIDSRLHIFTSLGFDGLAHRIVASSDWTSHCAVASQNEVDTLSFVVLENNRESKPIVVEGSATDLWMRVFKIGPDTLNGEIISKIWNNTDYTFFNYVYFCADNIFCLNNIDKNLDTLIQKCEEYKGKLFITGNNCDDIKCAFEYAKQKCKTCALSYDNALCGGQIVYDSSLTAPKNLRAIQNFSQVIVEWDDDCEKCSYDIFLSDTLFKHFPLVDELYLHKLNSELVRSKLFVLDEVVPEQKYYVSVSVADGKNCGFPSSQLVVQTKNRRKTNVYEFASKLGNPSAFDFSEYKEISMLHKNASEVDIYIGTDAENDNMGELYIKSPNMVTSEHNIWSSRASGIIFIDTLSLEQKFDVQRVTTAKRAESAKIILHGRYLLRTPDGYELVLRIEDLQGVFPNRNVDVQYLFRLIENAPVFKPRLPTE